MTLSPIFTPLFVLGWYGLAAQWNFPAQVIDDDVQIGYGLAIGDVDGDGRPDILLADKKDFVWYRNPDWQRFVMLSDLTERDNVCLAARDLDGDGKVEVAVGAQWNPGETKDLKASGSVHYLLRPEDPTQRWTPIQLPHEPTVHRMGWARTRGAHHLIVVPLHGRGNKGGQGRGVKIWSYAFPDDPQGAWSRVVVDSSLHITHNFDIIPGRGSDALLIGGKEGSKYFGYYEGAWNEIKNPRFTLTERGGFSEIRHSDSYIAGIQPFHGHTLAVYPREGKSKELITNLKQGHALACADLLGQGMDQILVGWREKNEAGDYGIKFLLADDRNWSTYRQFWIDQNEMACEDLKVADLDGDGKLDIIAAGRATHNLIVYWNRN